jgi:hypothetical protein
MIYAGDQPRIDNFCAQDGPTRNNLLYTESSTHGNLCPIPPSSFEGGPPSSEIVMSIGNVKIHGVGQMFALSVLVLYIASYAWFSAQGEYIVANHGGSDWRRDWCPKYLVEPYRGFSGRTKTHSTFLGELYWPCMVIDHLIWHKTVTDKLFG